MTISTREQFERLLTYELLLAARHRYFVTVVMIASRKGGIEVLPLLRETLRLSDGWLSEGGKSAVLMVHTTVDQARQAIDRFKARCGDLIDFRYAIAGYPQDAGVSSDLVSFCEIRLKDAMRAGFGAVVARDAFEGASAKLSSAFLGAEAQLFPKTQPKDQQQEKENVDEEHDALFQG